MHPDQLATVLGLSRAQGGLVTRSQVQDLGCGHGVVDRRVDQGQWIRWAPGLVQVHPGPLSVEGRAWGGVLLAGGGSCVVGRMAARLHGFAATPDLVVVAVPHGVRVADAGMWHFQQRRTMPQLRGEPPRSGVEETVLDLCAEDPSQSEHWVTEAVRRGLTTRPRLARALAARSRFPGRRDLAEMLAPSQEGIESPLESLFARKVLRAHGLPMGRRQVRGVGERVDVWFEEGLVVELDGRLGHEGTGRFRDMERDNRHSALGLHTLRYGWADCRHRACRAAEQVAGVLRLLGWEGTPVSCPECRVGRAA